MIGVNMITGYAVYTSIGTIRKENQDNFFLNGLTKPVNDCYMDAEGESSDAVQLFAVCDGMGGEESGEVAASLAVETLKLRDKETDLFQCMALIKEANRKICQYQTENHSTTGTTFAGILVTPINTYAINAGDSRIYRIRDNEIVQLSRDHTEYQLMMDAGIPMNERTKRSAKNRLTQYLGVQEEEMEMDLYISQISPLKEGDRYLICSDGLYGVVSDEELLSISGNKNNILEDICKFLVDAAEKMGSRDNITAMVIQIKETSEAVTEEKEITLQLLDQTQEIPIIEYPEAEDVGRDTGDMVDSKADVSQTVIVTQENEQNHTFRKSEKKKFRVFPIIVGIAGIILLMLAGYVYYLWNYPIVPDVLNMDAQQCRKVLDKAGLRIIETEEFSEDVPEGYIIRQSKLKNIRVKRGDEIFVTVSKGTEPIEVPDVVKKSLEEGTQLLVNRGFQVEIIRIYRKKGQSDVILGQVPDSGTMMKSGETVTIKVRTRKKKEEESEELF